MRTRAKVASVVSSLAVLLIGWQLGGQATAGQSPAGGVDAAAGSATTSGGRAGPSTGDAAGTGGGTSDSGTTDSGTTDSGTTDSGTTDTGTAGSGATSGSEAAGSGGSGTSGSAADGAYTGDVATTRYGDAQVSITVSGGRITDVSAIELPDDDRHSQQISWSAEPILRQSVLVAQSADVSVVSRATTTSHAYLESLQSALEKARL